MQNMQEYKCPCCGGAIAFDSTIQKMKCRIVIRNLRWKHCRRWMNN